MAIFAAERRLILAVDFNPRNWPREDRRVASATVESGVADATRYGWLNLQAFQRLAKINRRSAAKNRYNRPLLCGDSPDSPDFLIVRRRRGRSPPSGRDGDSRLSSSALSPHFARLRLLLEPS